MIFKTIENITEKDIDDLYDGTVQGIIVNNATPEDVKTFGELEEQDLYLKKEVPIGTDDETEDHVWQEVDMMWHSDRAYLDDVHPFCGLYCHSADEGSSPTYFTDNFTAWNMLSEDLKTKIKALDEVEFTVRRYLEKEKYPHTFRSPVWERAFYMHARAKHKLYRNDEFGEYLFYSEAYAIIDEQLKNEIERTIYVPENIYAHQWKPNQLVVWNNFTLTHRRDHTPKHINRRLLRYAFHRNET